MTDTRPKKDPKQPFPEDLLRESSKTRHKYFEDLRLSHLRIKDVRAQVIHAIEYPCNDSFIFVVGPPRAGKTTTFEGLRDDLTKQYYTIPGFDPGCIPYAAATAEAPEKGDYDWRYLYEDILIDLDEIAINKKIDIDIAGTSRGLNGELIITRETRPADLKRTLLKTLFYRNTIAVFIDEANSLVNIWKRQDLKNEMDIFKGISDKGKTMFVFFGTYDLLKLLDLSGQLAGRTRRIHFGRYSTSSKDMKAFETFLKSLQRHLPLEKEPNLMDHVDFFYEGSLGVAGLLHMWLCRALDMALMDNKQSLTMDMIEKAVLPPAVLDMAIDEIMEGEEKWKKLEDKKKRDEARGSVRQKLGLKPDPKLTKSKPEPKDESSEKPDESESDPKSSEKPDDSEASPKPPKGKKPKPGKPNPRRNDVGDSPNE